MSKRFIHLHTHSHYSLLTALPKIPALVKAAKENEMNALALTDNGNLYGAIQFYKECKKQEIKPIVGVDFFLATRTRHDKQAGIDNRRHRLILLAKDVAGYKNLIKLVTDSHLEGFYYKPRIDLELIEKYHEGLIAIIPSFSGDVVSFIKNKNVSQAKERLGFYQKLFKDDLYFEITHHPEIDEHEATQEKIKEFCKNNNLQIVAAQDVYYLNDEDKKARDTLVSIQKNNDKSNNRSMNSEEEDFSFISQDEACEKFLNEPEALANTLKIAEKCNLELDLGKWVFPNYTLKSDAKSYDDELRNFAIEGLKDRGLELNSEVQKRIDYELDIIKAKGYSPYFLVMADLIKYARENAILTNTRGSAAGSLVSYLVGITTVDPLYFELPFERFLNPERPSPPDIDLDIADNRRDDMIDYAKQKYGNEKVAQIGTFGTMMARGSVRDVARALGYPYTTGDKIAKLIPMGSQGFPMSIDRAIKMTPELKELYEDDEDTKIIIDLAKKIEGCARHISVHAAGVVISPTSVIDFVPLQLDSKEENKVITQYDMHGVEDAGLLKFDFLGIKNLAILANAVKLVKAIHKIEIDLDNIPIDDAKTYEMLTRGETLGLFQLNGTGMTKFLKDLRPTRIHDINAMVALYRPGPMESIPSYIERKHNPKKIKYLDPRMADILNQSYGVITYQDDVMMIAINLAGYSWLEADKLRKAMGKKIPAEMAAQKEKLHDGLIANGMSEEKAVELWKLIEPFAAYGFNKAHAASYGRVAYQTAYMKANYPGEYMAALLTADSGDVEKIAELVAESQKMNIPVLAPSINESFGDFTILKDETGDKIRFGLYSIKNFGEGIANSIIAERKQNGLFTSIANFLERIHDKNLNKKSLEALIKSGAMDDFGERGQMFGNIESLLEYSRSYAKNSSQDSLFGGLSSESTHDNLRLAEVEMATIEQKLAWEKELLGLYISGHPLDKFKHKLEGREKDVTYILETAKNNEEVVVGGLIEEAKTIITKNGDRMMFVKIVDLKTSIEVVVFSRIYDISKDILTIGKCVAIKGKVSTRNGEKSIVVEGVKEME